MQGTSEGELTMTEQYYCDRPLHKFMKSKTELKVAQVNILSIACFLWKNSQQKSYQQNFVTQFLAEKCNFWRLSDKGTN